MVRLFSQVKNELCSKFCDDHPAQSNSLTLPCSLWTPSGRKPAPLCLKEEAPSPPGPSYRRGTHCSPRKHIPDKPVEWRLSEFAVHLYLYEFCHYAWIDDNTFKTSTSSARRKSLFSATNRITSCMDFLLWTWPTGKHRKTTMWYWIY